MSYNLLYIACGHPLQEVDDVLTMEGLGFNVFSTGFLRGKQQSGDMPRVKHSMRNLSLSGCRAGTFKSDQSDQPIGRKNKDFTNENKLYNIWKMTSEFCSHFDIVVTNHAPHNIHLNLETFQKNNLIIIHKTFAMQPDSWEKIFKGFCKEGVYLIRNNAQEQFLYKNYAGHNKIIRGSCVIDQSKKWIGNQKKCLTLSSNFNHSEGRRRRDIYENIMKNCKWPMELWGAANQNVSYCKGFLSHNKKERFLRNFRCNLVVGTPGSSATFSLVETFLVGQPPIIFNKQLWGGNSLEESLFTHNEDCILISNPNEGAEAIDRLMKDKKFANKISRNAAKLGRRTWGRSVIAEQWRSFFNSIGLKV